MGIDLGDYYTGTLSLRRLRVLIRHLPGDSRLAKIDRARRREAGIVDNRRIEDADPAAWSQTDWLLVQVYDQLQELSYLYKLVHRDPKKPKPQPPQPLPRPGGRPARRKTLNAWFGAVGLPPPPSRAA